MISLAIQVKMFKLLITVAIIEINWAAACLTSPIPSLCAGTGSGPRPGFTLSLTIVKFGI